MICAACKIAHLYGDIVSAKVNERFDRHPGWSAAYTGGPAHHIPIFRYDWTSGVHRRKAAVSQADH
jgi:hypothetical protein